MEKVSLLSAIDSSYFILLRSPKRKVRKGKKGRRKEGKKGRKKKRKKEREKERRKKREREKDSPSLLW